MESVLEENEVAVPCKRCNGCGRIADSEAGEPWTLWDGLRILDAMRQNRGLVRPVPCPDCGGTGERGGYQR